MRLESQKEENKLANRIYEMMYIAQPETSADDIGKLNTAIQGVIEKEGGSVVKVDDWGVRKMAYPIKKKTDGYYVLFEIAGSGKEILELERRMRVNDTIIRFMTVRVDEERKAAEKINAKRDRRQANRAAKFNKPTEEAAAPQAEDNQ